MGVPAFFSWLIKRYPLVLRKAIISEMPDIECLYLDMNGILYKCAKDEKIMFKDLIQNKNYDELWVQIFNYINNIVNSVGPTKILFLALDGPAPRAKQNQQRSRRFQSAKNHEEVTKALQNCGFLSSDQTFKNNSISPGTEFMHQLNEQLKFFIARKYKEDDKWQNLQVIFSGSNVPGEGEHKILNYMREYTNQENYDFNTTHCIYGADADLIMLGLSTHIPYVSILREEMPPFNPKQASPAVKREVSHQKFEILYLNLVREYMDLEFQMIKPKMKHLKYDIDRIIDDFILLCFFIGNDFLPKCYCFDIRQGNIESLLDGYKEVLMNGTDYINDQGNINWKAFENLLEVLSRLEVKLISERAGEITDTFNKNKLFKYDDMCDDNEEEEEQKHDARNTDTFGEDAVENQKIYNQAQENQKKDYAKMIKKEKEFLQELEKTFQDDSTEGRKKYYLEKLDFDLEQPDDCQQLDFMMRQYVEGLQFVLKYYYRGCPSWSWYYPFYYSPMVTDLLQYVKYHNSQEGGIQIKYDKGTPYEPLKALLCILHPQNSSLLPPILSDLITDTKSPLRSPVDYFPTQFRVDPFGGVWDHEFVVSLPFLSAEKLDEVYQQLDLSKMSDEDKSRNQLTQNVIFSLNKDPKAKQTTIKSNLPFYKDFTLPLNSLSFSLDREILSKSKTEILEFNKDVKYVFPSIHTKKILNYGFQLIKGRDHKFKRLFLELQPEVVLPQVTPQDYIEVYTEYPCSQKAYIIGWMDENQLYKIKRDDGNIKLLRDVRYSKNEHQQAYHKALEDCREQMYNLGIEVDESMESQKKVLFLRYFTTIERSSNGGIIENENIYGEEFHISTALSTTQRLRKKCEIKDYNSVEEEFPLNSNVLVFDERYLGCRGTVKGYKKSQNTTLVNVHMNSEPTYPTQQQYDKFSKDNTIYFTLNYIAEELKIHPKTLLTLIDSVVVALDEEKPSAAKLQKRLDIGLRFVSRFHNTIVHEFVRLPDGDFNLEKFEKYNQYDRLEISKDGAQIIRNYFDEIRDTNIIPMITTAVTSKQKVNLSVSTIFRTDNRPKGFDENIEIVKLYLWVVQNMDSYNLAPVNGQVLSFKVLEQQISKHKDLKPKPIKVDKVIDPNLLQRQCDYIYVPMYFTDHPFYHRIGDRVININSIAKPNVPPFGALGTVVGIMDRQIQVVFDIPFIGGTNLGGKCQWLKGSELEFLDVFNLEGQSKNTWRQFLRQRDDKQYKIGWDRIVDQFYPEIKKKAISDSKQHDTFLQKFKHQTNIFEGLQRDDDENGEEQKDDQNINQMTDLAEIEKQMAQQAQKTQKKEKAPQKQQQQQKQKQQQQQQKKPMDLSEIEAKQPVDLSEIENQQQKQQQGGINLADLEQQLSTNQPGGQSLEEIERQQMQQKNKVQTESTRAMQIDELERQMAQQQQAEFEQQQQQAQAIFDSLKLDATSQQQQQKEEEKKQE